MGPALAALVLSTLPGRRVWFEGDSKYVISLLNKELAPGDVFLYCCAELVFDLTRGNQWL